MTTRSIFSTALVVLAVNGCSGEDDGGGLPSSAPESVCLATQAVCTGDTICGQVGCERAFDRTYQVRVATARAPGKRGGECPDDRNCVSPRVVVHYSERDDPILGAPGAPPVADIVATRGSFLIVEIRDRDCIFELTPARLRSGHVDCSVDSVSATLSLVALPL